MPKLDLVYFFEAEYYDGKIFTQHPEDISLLFPPTYDENGQPQGKSSAADIQEDLEKNLIRKFSLIGRGNKITVDLQTGLFYVNNLPILLESEKLPCLPDRFELVRYYQTSVDVDVTYDLKTGNPIAVKEKPMAFREYFIGWKCNINGKEYVQKIAVS